MIRKKKSSTSPNRFKNWFFRHKIFSTMMILVLLIVLGLMAKNIFTNWWDYRYQQGLESFYTAPNPLPSSKPGDVIRTEAMNNVTVPGGGTAYRMLYVTQLPNGTPAVSSGVVYVPTAPAPAGGRNVVAWAHGTLGFGNDCTPSRNPSGPLNDTDNWLGSMMQRGWVVTATDYMGIGTAGTPYYLIGTSEAHDVINSVRAAKNMPITNAGSTYVVWGHSQGGHSALFTAQLAKSYAPELKLVGAAAAAPAAELNALFSQQYNQAVAWGIGPDAVVSWPQMYPSLPINSVLSSAAQGSYERLAYGCVMQELGTIELRDTLGQQFFSTNPITDVSWYAAAQEQTPEPNLAGVPIYVAQGLSDTVVLPNTTALLVQNACKAGTNISANWFGDISHTQIAMTAGPIVTNWLADRFNNLPAVSNCNQPLPVSPATQPVSP